MRLSLLPDWLPLAGVAVAIAAAVAWHIHETNKLVAASIEIGRKEVLAEWRDADNRREAEAEAKKAEDAELAASKAAEHRDLMEQLNAQLKEADDVIAKNSTGRKCLPAVTVRVLNAPAASPADRAASVPAAAGESSSAPEAFATDRDVGRAIAVCRTRYAEVADQLNKILDIEEARDLRH